MGEKTQPMTTVLRTVRWLALGAIVGLGAAWAMKIWVGDHAAPQAIATAAIGGPFELVDQDGKTWTEKSLLGKYAIVYFGYTYCPDACPTALIAISQALDELGPKAAKFLPVFVTIDPERDTVKQIGAYVRTVDDRLVGLTGSAEQVARAAKAYRVFYRKVTPEGSAEYLMDHTSLIYLMGPDGKYVAHFSHEMPVEKIVETLRRYAG